MKLILVIEDDVIILKGLVTNLRFEGYDVIKSENGKEGLELALEHSLDLLLLDIMLPGMSGYEVCRKVKQHKPELPVIMISARGEEVDKISGLDIGADDYITKPFSIPELMARIRSVFRRLEPHTPDMEIYTFGNVKIDFKKFKTLVNGKEVRLRTKEYAILKYLISHEGEVINRYQLLEDVWGYTVMPTTRTVDNYILDIRRKIEEDSTKPQHIVSIRGAGYKFTGDKEK
jgi:DNA-binding response OmpR family regulator